MKIISDDDAFSQIKDKSKKAYVKFWMDFKMFSVNLISEEGLPGEDIIDFFLWRRVPPRQCGPSSLTSTVCWRGSTTSSCSPCPGWRCSCRVARLTWRRRLTSSMRLDSSSSWWSQWRITLTGRPTRPQGHGHCLLLRRPAPCGVSQAEDWAVHLGPWWLNHPSYPSKAALGQVFYQVSGSWGRWICLQASHLHQSSQGTHWDLPSAAANGNVNIKFVVLSNMSGGYI